MSVSIGRPRDKEYYCAFLEKKVSIHFIEYKELSKPSITCNDISCKNIKCNLNRDTNTRYPSGGTNPIGLV